MEKKLGKKRRRVKRNRRMKAVSVVITLCMVGLLLRIGYITEIYGADYERFAVRQLVIRQTAAVERPLPAVHGGILDRNRQPLVDSERVYDIGLDVNVLHSLEPVRGNPNPQERVLQAIHEILDIPMETLWDYMATNPDGTLVAPNFSRIIARQVPAYVAIQFRENNVRHVNLYQVSLRRFPDPYIAPQVLGFTRGDATWGLERQYNAEMSGEPGRVIRSFQTDSPGFIEDIPARDGYWLVTTLDAGIQRIAQRAVENAAHRYQAEYTGIVIMQPYTGEILAMAQWPSFPLDAPDDGSRFTNPQVANSWDDMSPEEQINHMNRTWSNFFLSRTFEPGSIFKPFVMAAAYEEGLLSPSMSHFYCTGARMVPGWHLPIGCHNRHGHGSMTLIEALMVSCNIAMIDMVQDMGRDTFYRYRNDFGFGERTGIDLPGEEAVSSPAVMYTLNQLNAVELATSSFGQGFNNTSIQAINAFAALINGGYVMRPYVVSQIVDAQGNVVHENTPSVVRNVLSQHTSDFMREAMQSVVSPYGTGRRAVIDGYTIGGKTGTGEQGVPRGDWVVTSFLGYMPVENPQFLAMAVVYNPADNQLTAGASAAPMLREVFEGIIQYRQLPPAGAEQTTGILLDVGREILPDFSGMELQEVAIILNNMGIDYMITGRGAIVSHHIPTAGQPTPRDTPIFLHLDGNIDNLYELTFVPNVEGLPESRAVEQIIAAGLVPVVVTRANMGRGDWLLSFDANEAEYEEIDEPADNWIIYRQFPSSGLHIQRGTQIRLRAREAE